jgi:hypothetical protein
MRKYQTKFKEESDDAKVQGIIDTVVNTKWSGSNEEQGKALELMKGLAFSDNPKANEFLKKIDDFTSSLKDS